MKIETKQISILGSMWTIRSATKEEEPRFEKEECDGFCDRSVKEIVIQDMPDESYTVSDKQAWLRHVLRHEIVHAFMYESGLSECSAKADAWAMNEEMIDWIAAQHENLHEAFRHAGALDERGISKLIVTKVGTMPYTEQQCCCMTEHV